MNAPTSPGTENVADLDSGITENDFPNGDDLAISRATDFYRLDELLTDQERGMRDRVRRWCDAEVARRFLNIEGMSLATLDDVESIGSEIEKRLAAIGKRCRWSSITTTSTCHRILPTPASPCSPAGRTLLRRRHQVHHQLLHAAQAQRAAVQPRTGPAHLRKPWGDELEQEIATAIVDAAIWRGLVGEHCIGTSQSRYHEGDQARRYVRPTSTTRKR